MLSSIAEIEKQPGTHFETQSLIISCKDTVNYSLTCSKSWGNRPKWPKILKNDNFKKLWAFSCRYRSPMKLKMIRQTNVENTLTISIKYSMIRARTCAKSWRNRSQCSKKIRKINFHKFDHETIIKTGITYNKIPL